MTPRYISLKVLQVCAVAVLIMGSRQVLADCDADVDDGWLIDSICTSHFDSNGQYDYSHCILDPHGDPWGRYHMTCKQGMDPGTCMGSNCEQQPDCTWDGFCTTDFDCCGLNWCDQDLQRCRAENNGGQW